MMKRILFILLLAACTAAFSTAQTGVEPFRQEGIASWYGGEFDGKPTASGEMFNSGLYTAAHPTLPFGTVLTVTNMQNNRRVTVRVNDRGPFVAARIIDLSRASAQVLDMLVTGTAPVIVERVANNAVLGPAGVAPAVVTQAPQTPVQPQPVQPAPPPAAYQPAPVQPAPPPAAYQPAPAQPAPPPAAYQPAPVQPAPPPAAYQPAPTAAPAPVQPVLPQTTAPVRPQPAPPPVYPAAEIIGGIPPAESTKSYRLQVGAYNAPRNAVDAFDKLRAVGLNPAYERHGDLYRVVLAGLSAGEIQSIAVKIGNAGFREALIREETGN